MAPIWLRIDVDCGSTGWTADLPAPQFAAWVKLLLAVKVGGEGGVIERSKFTNGTLKRNVGIDREGWEAMLAAGAANEALSLTSDAITVTNWLKYQQDPTNAARQRRHKQNEKVTGPLLPALGNGGNDDRTGQDRTLRDNDSASKLACPHKEIAAQWNKMAAATGLRAVQRISKERQAKLRTRWAEGAFKDGWATVLEKISESAFLKGSSGWKVTFDWFIKNGVNYMKVLEGNYDGDGRATRTDSGPSGQAGGGDGRTGTAHAKPSESF